MHEREGFLKRMEERFSRLSGWLARRRQGGAAGARDLPGRAEALRREIAAARSRLGAIAEEDLGRVRASLEAMRADYDVPPPHFALRRTELEALRRHLQTADRLASILANVDDPRFDEAHDEYERSWDEVERAFESEGEAASP